MNKKIKDFFRNINEIWLNLATRIQVWWIIHFRKRSWASKQAERIIKKSPKRRISNIFSKLEDTWEEWMKPQKGWVSFWIALVIVSIPQLLLVLLITRFVDPVNFSNDQYLEFLSTLEAVWQVLASILGISFVIIVFLTQYAMDRKFERKAMSLFASHSRMVFTVMMGLLTILSFGVNVLLITYYFENINRTSDILIRLVSIAFFNYLLFALNLFLTIKLYIITYKLLQPEYFHKIFRKYLRGYIQSRVHAELRDRIAENLVADQCIQNDIHFTYYEIETNGTPINLPVKENEIYYVSDVNLRLLSLSAVNARPYATNSQKIYFFGRNDQKVASQNPVIGYIPTEATKFRATYPLEKSVRLSKVSKRQSVSLENELLINQDMIIAAIREHNSHDIDFFLEIYLEVLKSFSKSLTGFGYKLNFRMAQRELGSFSDWSIVRFVRNQIINLIEPGFKSDDFEIVKIITFFPYQVMMLAFREKDHLLFSNFSDIFLMLYMSSNRYLNTQEHKVYVRDRCWRFLVEFDHYIVTNPINRNSLSKDDLISYSGFSKQILIVLDRLLKSAIDQKDLGQYQKISESMQSIFSHIDQKYTSERFTLLTRYRKHTDEQFLPKDFQEDYKKTKNIVELRKGVENHRRVFMIGHGAWLVHLFESNQITFEEFSDYISFINKEFIQPEILYDVFCDHISSARSDRLTDWSSWELAEKPERPGVVTGGFLSFDTWIARYYTIRMIELMPSHDKMTIPELIPSINSSYTLDKIKVQLQHLNKNAQWHKYVHSKNGNFEFREHVLIQVHKEAVKEQEIVEQNQIIQQDIDPNKIKLFIENVE